MGSESAFVPQEPFGGYKCSVPSITSLHVRLYLRRFNRGKHHLSSSATRRSVCQRFSSVVHSLPTPTPTSVLLSIPFVWSRMAAPACICISCVRVCHCCLPAKTKRPTRDRRRRSHAGRWRKNERGMKKGEEGSFRHQFLVGSQVHRAVRWERAGCTPVQSSWPPLHLGHAPSRRRRVCGRRVHLLQAGTRK